MAFCRECGAEIGEAKFCSECGAGQVTPMQQVPAAPPQAAEKKKQPILGLVGILLMAAGLCVASTSDSVGFGVVMLGVGAVVLAFALFSGNIKFLG